MARPLSGPIASIVLFASLAAACSAAATAAPSGTTGTSPSPVAATTSPSAPGDSVTRPSFPAVSIPIASPGSPVELPAVILDPLLADVARRSGVPREQLVIVSATSTTWSDGSLGCPTPGQMYTQALVEGWQAVVRAGAKLYDYRGAGVGTLKLCKTYP